MRAALKTVYLDMPDPDPPQPTPFPIKIVSDPMPAAAAVNRGDDDSDKPPKSRTDEFYPAWDQFLALEPRRGKKLSRPARKTREEQKEVEKSPGAEGVRVQNENAANSWEQAAAECRAKVKAIVDECRRLNQKYRDAIFDLEADGGCLQGLHGAYPKAVEKIEAPPWVKRVEDIFDDPQFFIDGATAQDVHQGSGGDCWFLAALMAVSAKKELIDQLCVARDEAAGVYGFVFYRDGEWIYEVIDDKLFLRVGDDDNLNIVRDWSRDKKQGMALGHDAEKLLNTLQRGGEALYFSHCKSSETWLPLIEKAYAKAHGDYFAIEGGFASEAIEDLTGGVAVVINPEEIMDKERFWREQLSLVNEKYLFGGGTKPTATKGLSGGHAYAVLKHFEEGDLKLLKIRNPWGEKEWEGDWADGSKQWTPEMMRKLDHKFGNDGIFWMTYKDFLKHFPAINRVRLFNKEWQVAQQWTSVNVPWTVDYLDTKFQFTITKKCPVVLVLMQPDDRYFYGLSGRFMYALHFRVYREDEEGRWIVRSMHNSGGETMFTRSVSAEIEDLEPGTYSVVVKVTATRADDSQTYREAVLKHANVRKEKLLSVGRRFDYAHTKGNLRAMEVANRKRVEDVNFKLNQSKARRARQYKQIVRERARRQKKRVNEAMREKRKAVEEKRRANELERRRSRAGSESAAAEGGSDEKSESKGAVTPAESPSKETVNDAEPGAEQDKEKETVDKPKPSPEPSSKAKVVEKSVEEPVEKEPDEKTPEDNKKSEGDAMVVKIAEDVAPGDGTKTDTNDLTRKLSGLQLDATSTKSSVESGPVCSLQNNCYESPGEEPDSLGDDDFDFDSDMDGPFDFPSDDEDSAYYNSAQSEVNEIFADDPWNAICVLGLRVYSHNADVKIKVLKGEGDS